MRKGNRGDQVDADEHHHGGKEQHANRTQRQDDEWHCREQERDQGRDADHPGNGPDVVRQMKREEGLGQQEGDCGSVGSIGEPNSDHARAQRREERRD